VELPPDLHATLVLVRHGESTWVAEGRFQGRGDPPLSALGRQQAELVAGRLADGQRGTSLPVPPGPPTAIWHSPLARAAQTAQFIADLQSGVTARPLANLTEIAMGEWQGLTHDEVTKRWSAELAAWRRAPAEHHAPGGESLPVAAVRVGSAVRELLGILSGAAAPVEPWAIVVAHDGIFRITLLTMLDLPLERFWSFPFSLCAISVLSLRGGVASLKAHNLADHLAPLTDASRAPVALADDRGGAL
jgi:broad specificity phosphatase PhoE